MYSRVRPPAVLLVQLSVKRPQFSGILYPRSTDHSRKQVTGPGVPMALVTNKSEPQSGTNPILTKANRHLDVSLTDLKITC